MEKVKPRGILFDLDDTIITFGVVATPVWKQVCDKYAEKLQPFTGRQLYDAIAKYSRWYWSDPLRHRTGRLDMTAARHSVVLGAFASLSIKNGMIARQMADEYIEEHGKKLAFFPGAEQTLHTLKEQGIPIVLVTNGDKRMQRMKVERFGLERFFDKIFIEGELGYGKPEPRVYFDAAASLGLTPEQSWIVGDNLEWEVAVPQRLGMYTVWNDAHKTGLPNDCTIQPHRMVESIAELLPIRQNVA
ncbi:MAG: HAD family hydrolase [Chitinivibrionales bacterium]